MSLPALSPVQWNVSWFFEAITFKNPMPQKYTDRYNSFEISKERQLEIKLEIYPNSLHREKNYLPI